MSLLSPTTSHTDGTNVNMGDYSLSLTSFMPAYVTSPQGLPPPALHLALRLNDQKDGGGVTVQELSATADGSPWRQTQNVGFDSSGSSFVHINSPTPAASSSNARFPTASVLSPMLASLLHYTHSTISSPTTVPVAPRSTILPNTSFGSSLSAGAARTDVLLSSSSFAPLSPLRSDSPRGESAVEFGSSITSPALSSPHPPSSELPAHSSATTTTASSSVDLDLEQALARLRQSEAEFAAKFRETDVMKEKTSERSAETAAIASDPRYKLPQDRSETESKSANEILVQRLPVNPVNGEMITTRRIVASQSPANQRVSGQFSPRSPASSSKHLPPRSPSPNIDGSTRPLQLSSSLHVGLPPSHSLPVSPRGHQGKTVERVASPSPTRRSSSRSGSPSVVQSPRRVVARERSVSPIKRAGSPTRSQPTVLQRAEARLAGLAPGTSLIERAEATFQGLVQSIVDPLRLKEAFLPPTGCPNRYAPSMDGLFKPSFASRDSMAPTAASAPVANPVNPLSSLLLSETLSSTPSTFLAGSPSEDVSRVFERARKEREAARKGGNNGKEDKYSSDLLYSLQRESSERLDKAMEEQVAKLPSFQEYVARAATSGEVINKNLTLTQAVSQVLQPDSFHTGALVGTSSNSPATGPPTTQLDELSRKYDQLRWEYELQQNRIREEETMREQQDQERKQEQARLAVERRQILEKQERERQEKAVQDAIKLQQSHEQLEKRRLKRERQEKIAQAQEKMNRRRTPSQSPVASPSGSPESSPFRHVSPPPTTQQTHHSMTRALVSSSADTSPSRRTHSRSVSWQSAASSQQTKNVHFASPSHNQVEDHHQQHDPLASLTHQISAQIDHLKHQLASPSLPPNEVTQFISRKVEEIEQNLRSEKWREELITAAQQSEQSESPQAQLLQVLAQLQGLADGAQDEQSETNGHLPSSSRASPGPSTRSIGGSTSSDAGATAASSVAPSGGLSIRSSPSQSRSISISGVEPDNDVDRDHHPLHEQRKDEHEEYQYRIRQFRAAQTEAEPAKERQQEHARRAVASSSTRAQSYETQARHRPSNTRGSQRSSRAGSMQGDSELVLVPSSIAGGHSRSGSSGSRRADSTVQPRHVRISSQFSRSSAQPTEPELISDPTRFEHGREERIRDASSDERKEDKTALVISRPAEQDKSKTKKLVRSSSASRHSSSDGLNLSTRDIRALVRSEVLGTPSQLCARYAYLPSPSIPVQLTRTQLLQQENLKRKDAQRRRPSERDARLAALVTPTAYVVRRNIREMLHEEMKRRLAAEQESREEEKQQTQIDLGNFAQRDRSAHSSPVRRTTAEEMDNLLSSSRLHRPTFSPPKSFHPPDHSHVDLAGFDRPTTQPRMSPNRKSIVPTESEVWKKDASVRKLSSSKKHSSRAVAMSNLTGSHSDEDHPADAPLPSTSHSTSLLTAFTSDAEIEQHLKELFAGANSRLDMNPIQYRGNANRELHLWSSTDAAIDADTSNSILDPRPSDSDHDLPMDSSTSFVSSGESSSMHSVEPYELEYDDDETDSQIFRREEKRSETAMAALASTSIYEQSDAIRRLTEAAFIFPSVHVDAQSARSHMELRPVGVILSPKKQRA